MDMDIWTQIKLANSIFGKALQKMSEKDTDNRNHDEICEEIQKNESNESE